MFKILSFNLSGVVFPHLSPPPETPSSDRLPNGQLLQGSVTSKILFPEFSGNPNN